MSNLREELIKAITEVYVKAPQFPKVEDVADAVLPIVEEAYEQGRYDGAEDAIASERYE